VPEGDSIHRTAAALRIALVDKKMVRFDAPHLIGVVPKAGRTIVRVESGGKHLEIEWDDGIILHTLLRKSGFWDLYRKDDIWQRPHREMRALIETAAWVAVCFNAPTVETIREPGISRHPWFGRLGPDLCSVDADLDRCVELLLSYDDRRVPICDVLLDQRVFGGVGNVYRSEVLWACELHPFAPVGDIGEALARRIVNVAARLLRANLSHAEQVALPGVPGGLGVYGRTGRGCFRCAATVRAREGGAHERILYWCPGCQTRLAPEVPDAAAALKTDQHPAAKAFREDTPWPTAG
jgi:endonuclease VIII